MSDQAPGRTTAVLAYVKRTRDGSPNCEPADETFYVARHGVWKYFRGLEEASVPDATAWRSPEFDDAAWSEGPAAFGYGDPPYGTDLSTLEPPNSINEIFGNVFLLIGNSVSW